MSDQEKDVLVQLPATPPAQEMPEEIRLKLNDVILWVFEDMKRAAVREAEKLGVTGYSPPGGKATLFGDVPREGMPDLRAKIDLTVFTADAVNAAADEDEDEDEDSSPPVDCPCPACTAKRAIERTVH